MASLIAFGLVIVIGDQLLKWYILNNLALGEVIPFIPGFVQLTYFQNMGIAFGFLQNHHWVPMVVNPIIVIGLIVVLARGIFPGKIQRWAMVAVIAGAVGNLIDRFVHGFVIDMFQFTFVRFAIFNIADVFITLGGIVWAAAYVIEGLQNQKKASEPSHE